MQQLKDLLNVFDVIVGTFWGVTLMEIIPVLTTGTTIVFTQLDNVIKIAFAFVGLIYAIVRLYNFIHMAKLNLDYRKQEIIEKQNANFRKKWNDEFLNKEENATNKEF